MPKKKAIVEERLLLVSELYLKGNPQSEICKVVGVTQQQISLDLKALRKQWNEQVMIHTGEAISKQLAKIDVLEVEYWDAWEKSRTDHQRKKQRFIEKPSSVKLKLLEKTKEKVDKYQKEFITEEVIQSGNPEYLKGVQWCISERSKILGLNAPERKDYRIYGSLSMEVKESIQVHIHQELFQDLSLMNIVVAKVSARLGLNSLELLTQLNKSYYAMFSGMQKPEKDVETDLIPSITKMIYNWDEIKKVNEENVKKKERLALREENIQDIKEINDLADSIKADMLDLIKKKKEGKK